MKLYINLRQTDLPRGFRFYTDADIDAIIDAVRPIELPGKRIVIHRSNDAGLELIEVTVARRTALSERLEATAHSFHFVKQEQARLPRSKIAKRLASIARNAEALHHALSLPENGNPSSGVQQVLTKIAIVSRREAAEGNGAGRGDEALIDAIRGIGCVARWAKDGEAEIRARMERFPIAKRNGGDEGLNEWVFLLGNIWNEIYEREPGTSVGAPTRLNERKAGGPLVRLIAAAGKPLGIALSDESIRERVRCLFKGKGKSSHRKS